MCKRLQITNIVGVCVVNEKSDKTFNISSLTQHLTMLTSVAQGSVSCGSSGCIKPYFHHRAMKRMKSQD